VLTSKAHCAGNLHENDNIQQKKVRNSETNGQHSRSIAGPRLKVSVIVILPAAVTELLAVEVMWRLPIPLPVLAVKMHGIPRNEMREKSWGGRRVQAGRVGKHVFPTLVLMLFSSQLTGF
jgi:hypothetical protein